MNKKKILYIVTKSNWGGAQKYVFDLATSLPKDQYEVTVAFGASGGEKSGRGTLESRLLKEKDIKIISISSLERDISFLKDFNVFRELISIYREVQPDIIHLNSSKIGGLGALAARLYKMSCVNCQLSKIIFTAHGWPFNEKRNFLARFIIWKLSVWTALLSTNVIVLAEKERRQTRRFLVVPQKKIHLIRNGLRHMPILSRDEALQKLELDPQHKYVGTISELNPNKGLDTLIRIAPQIEAHIVIIGTGELEGNLKNLARELKIAEKIHFLGAIEHAGTYLKAFDVFTLTSKKEGLPYALMEAGSAGLPAVASNVGGIPEIVLDQTTGYLCDPEDTECFKDKIEQLLHNTERAQHLGLEAKRYIEKQFSFENMLKRTQKLY